MRASRLLIVGPIAFCMALAIGHSKAQPVAAEGAPASSSARIFKSAGVSAVVSGLNVDQPYFQFQIILKNDRAAPILLSPIFMPSSSEMAATTTNGQIFLQQAIAGVASCNGQSNTIAASVANCMKDFQTSAMTRLEPGDITTMNITYILSNGPKPAKEDAKISLVLKFLVRAAPQEEDSLEAAAKGKAIGAPSIVTISFPLMPMNAQ